MASLVEFAREHGLRVAPQGTGHSAAPMGSLDGTLLLKTERMRELRIDPSARTARVGAGVLWAEVTNAAAEHGLAALAGSSPDVGGVGYTLGGGVSFMVRKHGLAANRVIAIELVTADGELIRVDAGNHADLFWALRGGGGSFGIVTARVHPPRRARGRRAARAAARARAGHRHVRHWPGGRPPAPAHGPPRTRYRAAPPRCS